MRILSILIALVVSLPVFAANPDVVLTIDPMKTPVRALELRHFNTVGEAARNLGKRIGYTFQLAYPAPTDAAFIADLPILPSAIDYDVVPLEKLLLDMVADDYVLIVDPTHMKFSYGLKTEKDMVSFDVVERIFTGNYIVAE